MALIDTLESAWYDGGRAPWWTWPLMLLYAGLTRLRGRLYRSGVLRSVRLPVPVVVIGNPPEGKRPADCAVRVAGPDRCTAAMSADTISKRDAERSAVADAVAAGMTAVYVDPDAWFCTAGGSCPVGAGGQIIRIDASHLTAGYSRSLGTLLRSALIAARVVPGAEAR